MFAALAQGTSTVRNLSGGADVVATLSVLQQLGIEAMSSGDTIVVSGKGLNGLSSPSSDLDCCNSGTTLRLMLGILAGSRISCRLCGDVSLNRRPVMRVTSPLRQMGADIRTEGDDDHPPVLVRGASLHGITYRSPVSSAQAKSAVLFAALNAHGDTTYHEPSLSRDHTERFLQYQGAHITAAGKDIRLSPPAELTTFDYQVPGDISTAMFFIVASTLLADSELTVENVLLNPTRTGAIDILTEMGAEIIVENQRSYCCEDVGDLMVRSTKLQGIDASRYDPVRFIDEVPILAVAAAFADGETTFANLGELRVKESDRLQGIVNMLSCYGCRAEVHGDSLRIRGGIGLRQRPPDHQGDHRLAMALAVLELATSGSIGHEHQDCIAISAPEFYHTLREITK